MLSSYREVKQHYGSRSEVNHFWFGNGVAYQNRLRSNAFQVICLSLRDCASADTS